MRFGSTAVAVDQTQSKYLVGFTLHSYADRSLWSYIGVAELFETVTARLPLTNGEGRPGGLDSRVFHSTLSVMRFFENFFPSPHSYKSGDGPFTTRLWSFFKK